MNFCVATLYTSALRKTPSLLLRFIHTLYMYQALELLHKEQPNHNYNCVALGDAIAATAAVCRFLFLFVVDCRWVWMANAPSFSFFHCWCVGTFLVGCVCVCRCGVCLFDDDDNRTERTKKQQQQQRPSWSYISVPSFRNHVLECVLFFSMFSVLVATTFLCLSLLLTLDRPLPATQSNFQRGWLFLHLKYQNTHKKLNKQQHQQQKSWRRKFISCCFISLDFFWE